MTEDDKELGRLLFGSAARYEVGVWIATRTEEVFYPAMIFDETGATYSTSLTNHTIFDRFVDLDMLEPDTLNHNLRSTYYCRLDSPLWNIFRVAAAALGQASAAVMAVEMAAMKTKLLALHGRVAAAW